MSSSTDSNQADSRALLIKGGQPLEGEVNVSGSKNAALPIIAASILSPNPVTLRNVPLLDDVRCMCDVLVSLGATCRFSRHTLHIDPTTMDRHTASYELVRRMRASFLVLGPLLARFQRAEVPLPGGCNIGPRPVNEHLRALGDLGAQMDIRKGVVFANTKKLTGTTISFTVSSVGATENVLMAAVKAEGTTVLENCAEEPEVEDLINFLSSLGARISRTGTRRLEVHGVSELAPPSQHIHTIIPDRIEAGTYALAAVGTRGQITLRRCRPAHLVALLDRLGEMGVEITSERSTLHIRASGELSPVELHTQPYPGFPTDLQPQMVVVLTRARGVSIVTEGVFEQRFSYIPELNRMGGNVAVRESSAIIDGRGSRLMGAPVEGYDIRGVAALSIAALMARGESLIRGYHHLVRGYEGFVEKFTSLGGRIRLVNRNHRLRNNHPEG